MTQNDLALARLTEPQRECLRLVMAGYKSKEIAHALGIGVDAVNKRIASAKETLGAPSRFAAAWQLAVFEGQEAAHSLVSQTLAVEWERPVVDLVVRSAVEDFHHDEPTQIYRVQEPHTPYGAAAGEPIQDPAQGFAFAAGQLVATPLRTLLLCLVVDIILALLTPSRTRSHLPLRPSAPQAGAGRDMLALSTILECQSADLGGHGILVDLLQTARVAEAGQMASALLAEFGSLAKALSAGAPALQRVVGNRPDVLRCLALVRQAMLHALSTEVSSVNRRSNGTHFGGISACKRGPLAVRRWSLRDNQDEKRLSGLRWRSGVARPEAQARQVRSFPVSPKGISCGF